MSWSRYNTLFHSARFGYFLYNALSNMLLEVDAEHFTALEGLRECRNDSSSSDEAFLALLRKHKILVEPGEENQQLLIRQYGRNAICFDTSRLDLTICPTLKCNFRCFYCFENSQQHSAVMTPKTVERLLMFIKNYKEIRHLSIDWYGGEPLLAFDVIRDITGRVKALDVDFEGADLITNGYLLDKKKIALLRELRINSIQITLDGLQDVHDTRRALAGGGPTFWRILANVDALMDSPYEIPCAIRVNLDKKNIEGFIALRAFLLERFKGKQLSVYAGKVTASLDQSCDQICTLDLQEWSDFTLGMYRRNGLMPNGGLYPGRNMNGVCLASKHNDFVVGPEGELYKCWEDVGKAAMVIGNIYEEDPVTNPKLRALYCTGTDPYSDPVCRECSVLPICGGGCANKRLRVKEFGEKGLEFCSPYKDHLIAYLEAYVDLFRAREICVAVLTPGCMKQDGKGFRVISPQEEEGWSRRVPSA